MSENSPLTSTDKFVTLYSFGYGYRFTDQGNELRTTQPIASYDADARAVIEQC